MTNKEAMKLALEALETEVSIDWTNDDEFNASAEKMHEAIAALKEALAQPEQEPVAWYYPDGSPDQCTTNKAYAEMEPAWTPLYTYPPQRTEPPQKKIWTFWDLSGGDITDAIKAKLKEKNNG